jgi:hypothetical protein
MASAFTTASFFGQQPKEARMDVATADLDRVQSNAPHPDSDGDANPTGADSSSDVSHGEWVKKP